MVASLGGPAYGRWLTPNRGQPATTSAMPVTSPQ